MQTLEFTLEIKTTPEKLWWGLWDPEKYKEWTAIFCEGSYYKTAHFSQGNTIHLLTPSGDGMYSVLEEVILNERLVFKHIGELKNFEEQPLNEKSLLWTNALEIYEIQPTDKGVCLTVKVDTFEDYVVFMNKTFPLALEKLKNSVE